MKSPETTDENTGENTDENTDEPPGKLPDEPPAGSEQKVPKKVEDINIPSQADIFRSVAEQLSISKAEEAKGGTPLSAIINYVQRTGLLNVVPFRAVHQHNR